MDTPVAPARGQPAAPLPTLRKGPPVLAWRRAVIAWLEQRTQREIWLIAIGLVTLFGATEYLIQRPLELTVLYVVPVGLIAYYIGRQQGVLIAVLAAAVWTLAVDYSGAAPLPGLVLGLNGAARTATLLVVVVLIDGLRTAYETQRDHALTDGLTGAANRRDYVARVQRELSRSRRYHRALTLVHFDLDGFKAVNDRLGHLAGDKVLATVAEVAAGVVRLTDTVARLGGDEFALLLPETDAAGARIVTERFRSAFLNAMQAQGWAVTGSFGVLTCQGATVSLEELLHTADQLMYQSKTAGKNQLSFGALAA